MTINPIDALSAYRHGESLQGLGSGAEAAPVAGEGSFQSLLKTVAGDAIDSLKKAEAVSAQGAMGKAGAVEIATAVSEAEMTLQVMVSLRDKAIAAYQEITRMGV